MVKIMHIADVHLDRKTEGLTPEKSLLRRAEYKETFEKAIDTAKKENVKIILICGDLFDSCQTEEQTIVFVRRVFAKVPEIYIFISPGNHDPLSAGIYKKLCENLSENVKIFGSTAECVYLDSINTRVYGMGFASEYQKDCLLQNFRVQNDDTVNLICIHGDLKSQSEYNPVSPSDIADTGADYVALGHTHTFSGIQKSGKTHYAYSGALEPGGFDETGEKTVSIVELSDSGCRLTPVCIASRRYEILPVEVTGCDPLLAVHTVLPENTARDVYRIVLTGEVDTPPDLSRLRRNLDDCFFSLQLRDETRLRQDVWERAEEDSLRGIFLRKLREKYNSAQSEERELIEQAARWGLAALDNMEEVVRHEDK